MKRQQTLANRVAILGLGLIGGSLALALKRAAAVSEIVAWGRNQQRLDKAIEMGIVDRATTDMAAAIAGADVIVIATPLGTMSAVLDQLVAVLPSDMANNVTITDVGSAKVRLIELAKSRLNERFSRFVPGHPVAGAEHSGFEAATADLYEKRRVVLTPVSDTDATAVQLVTELWQCCGAELVIMDAQSHDDLLALTSHLPHVVAYLLVDLLVQQGGQDARQFAAGGFYDITRIASSNPEMWRDIFNDNSDSVVKLLDHYIDGLSAFKQAIADGDDEALMQVMQRAKSARDGLV
ncbi:MAG: prephenate dehydrogenase/arogenate dehydrogenase family protein [Gammaproteobacteria bacterium]|nr:prephenate dehydrogenase/arogenate dehydrogenase family protein [Gammaproteobacteria bacterium]